MRLFVLALALPALALAGMPGAPEDADFDDLSAHEQQLLQMAHQHLTEAGFTQAKSECLEKTEELVKLRTQVVAGKNYFFTVEHCCATSSSRSCKTCTVKVYDVPFGGGHTEVVEKDTKCNEVAFDPVDDIEVSVEADDEDISLQEDDGSTLHRVSLQREVSSLRISSVDDNQVTNSDENLPGDSDHQPHVGQPLLGGGDHDYQPHGGQHLLGGGDHDYQPHSGQHLLGGGDHDYQPHGGQQLLGSGDHDYQSHGPKKLLSPAQSAKQLAKLQSLKSFHKFISTHGKTYESKAEYKKRYFVFKENMKKVQFLRESELGTGQYGATHLADLTEEEFKTQYLGTDKKLKNPDIHWPPAEIPNISLPKEFDWRKHNAVTEVKNQGMCGSCWAFSVTGNVEGQWAVKNGELLSLSEQELVDCDTRDSGCNGGLPENAYKTILEIGGLETEADYGYDGEDEKCKFNRSKIAARVTGGVEISQNETKMAQWLVANGPISIGLNANAMQFYMGGVSHPWKFLCSPDGIDHGVLIVGYGMHEYPLFHRKMPYWIIKNSWGTGWGEQGYYRLYRGAGTCGVNMMTSSAVVADNNQD